ncbi:class I SAM-dependent methyltransferase [Nocardia sp. NBC_01329]|uniref:class I SAM-dependent methyltransferase n=1 Tax=Nocardia sp. NBC_01329 TaxID=2903594 RepID=UPI002E0E46BC|nr:methyltransferase domain-containing protein [Nocardia sp. NBC_01329]
MALFDLFTDRLLRRPRGPLARLMWRDMKSHHEIFRDTLAELHLSADDHLLEVGCGGGTFAARALESGCRMTTVDHSADMVALTGSRNNAAVREGRLEVLEGTAEALPLPDQHFSCVTAMNILFFVDTPKTLSELHRVLRPNGRVVLHTVAPDPPRSLMPPPVARRAHFHSDSELRTMLETAGLGTPRVRRVDNIFQIVTATRPD